MLPDSPTFGTIWYAKGGVYGPEPVMVISSPAMPRLAPGRVAVVQVVRLDDPWPKPHPMIAETIPGVGIAALTDFTTIPQGWFIDPSHSPGSTPPGTPTLPAGSATSSAPDPR
ncbi:hypothetical protein ACFQBS_34325 [Planomonospora parontospora]|uniref:hypothetical protein n=1 Tax=Planomonospora parontospora TaxID=58119 RepID=UPI003617592A